MTSETVYIISFIVIVIAIILWIMALVKIIKSDNIKIIKIIFILVIISLPPIGIIYSLVSLPFTRWLIKKDLEGAPERLAEAGRATKKVSFSILGWLFRK